MTSLPKAISVKKIIQENFKTKSFILDGKIQAKPGQFIMVWLPGVAEKPFSITDTNPFTFTAMAVGNFTKTLNTKIKAGDKVWYRGPFGDGVYKPVPGKKILVSGGCGCVPLYHLAKTLKDKKNITVVIGAKTKKELLFVGRFKDLRVKTIVTTDDGSQGKKGLTVAVLNKLIPNNLIANNLIACVYSCGPEPMLKKIAQICQKNKIKYQLSLEALVKCGFGVCGACSCGGKLVCKDGPVFSKWPYEI